MSLAWSGDPKDENADPLARLPVVFIDEWRDKLDAKTMTFWRVYNRIARAWYDLEYGVHMAPDPRWYHPAMIFMECLADGWSPQRALDYIKPRRQKR